MTEIETDGQAWQTMHSFGLPGMSQKGQFPPNAICD
jgi:hypothetical protein